MEYRVFRPEGGSADYVEHLRSGLIIPYSAKATANQVLFSLLDGPRMNAFRDWCFLPNSQRIAIRKESKKEKEEVSLFDNPIVAIPSKHYQVTHGKCTAVSNGTDFLWAKPCSLGTLEETASSPGAPKWPMKKKPAPPTTMENSMAYSKDVNVQLDIRQQAAADPAAKSAGYLSCRLMEIYY